LSTRRIAPTVASMFAAALLILVAILYRVVPVMAGADQSGWLPNFAPLAAIALCGAIYLPRRAAVILPLAALLVSDVVLNVFHYHKPLISWEILPHYLALGLVSWLGFTLRGRVTALRLVGASFVGSVIFYLITNTGSWIGEPLYAKTAAGWFQAMTTGLPGFAPTWMFYRNTLVGDLVFTALFFVCHTITARAPARPEAVRTVFAA
jgi:hypothetical protein